jgi:GTP-dependent phosphoenolpyruvate carboxykinase
MNPRYIAYAKAHGKTPDAMLAHDKKEWPGGCMTGFILWMREQKGAFRKASPESFYMVGGALTEIADQEAWDNFLQNQ